MSSSENVLAGTDVSASKVSIMEAMSEFTMEVLSLKFSRALGNRPCKAQPIFIYELAGP